MALRENERVALICNMFIETVPSTPELELPSMQKVIELLQQLCRAGVAEEFDDKGETLLYIADVQIMEKADAATVLFTHADRRGSDPTLMAFRTRKHRRIPKGRDEGVPFSAHMVLELTPVAGLRGRHRCVIEQVPTVSRSNIVAFLSKLIRDYAQRNQAEFLFKSDSGAAKSYYPKLRSETEASKTLKEDLR